MYIFRYNADIQSAIKAKTEAQPWLHIAVSEKGYDIYVWDTREVIESGKIKGKLISVAELNKTLGRNCQFANDNLTPLKGKCNNDWIGRLGKWFSSNRDNFAKIAAMSGHSGPITIYQSIQNTTSFDDERYPYWNIGLDYVYKKPFKANQNRRFTILGIYDEHSAYTTCIRGMYKYDESKLSENEYNTHVKPFKERLTAFAKIGFTPDSKLLWQAGATPMDGTIKF